MGERDIAALKWKIHGVATPDARTIVEHWRELDEDEARAWCVAYGIEVPQ